MTAEALIGRLRQFLLGMTVLSLLVTLAELVLEKHYQEPLQFVPFILGGAGLLAAGAALLNPQRPTLLALRAVGGVLVLGGGMGMAVHLITNFGFQQEIRPNAAAGDLIVTALQGAAPLLAPGALAFAGLLALAATYYHPVLVAAPREA